MPTSPYPLEVLEIFRVLGTTKTSTMAPAPLVAAGALAGAAYVNARFSLAHDVLYFRIIGSALFRLFRASRSDKISAFYILEKQALDKTTGGRPFILFEARAYSYAETYQTVLRY